MSENKNWDYAGDKAKADKISEKPQLEQKREWGHGTEGRGKDCYRADRFVYTPPQKVPEECHGCTSREWVSKGLVTRDKQTKKVIVRDGKVVR